MRSELAKRLLAAERPRLRFVFPVSQEAAQELAELRDKGEDGKARIAEIEADANAVVTLQAQALSRAEYRELKDACPPRDIDHKRAAQVIGTPDAKARWNDDTFPRLLIAASVTDLEGAPVFTPEDLEEADKVWSEQQFDALFVAALQVQTDRGGTDWGKG